MNSDAQENDSIRGRIQTGTEAPGHGLFLKALESRVMRVKLRRQ